MNGVTEADRETAYETLLRLPDIMLDMADVTETQAAREVIAAALAAERERVRSGVVEPFEKLAAELDAESNTARLAAEMMPRTDENVRHHTAQIRHARVASHTAGRIRAVIAEVER